MQSLSLKLHLKKEIHDHPMGALSALILFVTLAIALADTVWSLYINSFTHNPAVTGFVLTGLTILTTLYFILFSAMMEHEHEKKVFVLSLAITGCTFLLFPFIKSFWVFAIIAAISFVGFALRNLSLGFLLRDASKPSTIGENEGIKYVMENLGYLVAPLLIIAFFDGTDFLPIFWLAGGLILVAAVAAAFMGLRERKTSQIAGPLEGFREFWLDKERVTVYCMRAGAAFFWSYIYVYLPLYIMSQGYPASYLGYVLFAIILPLVLFEYWIGKSVPQFGYRNAFIIGFLISGGAFTAAFFTGSKDVFVILMVIGSFGIAFLEPTIEAYYFRITKRSEQGKLYGTYLTAQQTGFLIGRFGGALLLLFLSLQNIVLFFGVVLLGFAWLARRVKE